MPTNVQFLPPNALAGKSLGISVSDSDDLKRLGLLPSHMRLALGELARTIVLAGGHLYYGGHLKPQGLTPVLAQEIKRHNRLDFPFKSCLAWPVHHSMPMAELEQHKREFGFAGEILFLDRDGQVMQRTDDRTVIESALEGEDLKMAFTALREFLIEHTDGRIVLGGRRRSSQGRMPGVIEETLMCMRAKQPLFLAGGFGGVTIDIIEAIDPQRSQWFVKQDNEPSAQTAAGLADIRALAASQHWPGLQNGLTDTENMQLAASHRPDEVAALVALGLGRLAQRGLSESQMN